MEEDIVKSEPPMPPHHSQSAPPQDKTPAVARAEAKVAEEAAKEAAKPKAKVKAKSKRAKKGKK